jgi:hypothetical protein
LWLVCTVPTRQNRVLLLYMQDTIVQLNPCDKHQSQYMVESPKHTFMLVIRTKCTRLHICEKQNAKPSSFHEYNRAVSHKSCKSIMLTKDDRYHPVYATLYSAE